MKKSYVMKEKWLDEVNICFTIIEMVNCLTKNKRMDIKRLKILPIKLLQTRNTNYVSSPTLKPPTHAYISITIVIVYYFCYLLVILYHQQKTIPLSFFRYIQYSICSLSLYSEFI